MARQTADKIRALHAELKDCVEKDEVSIEEVRRWKIEMASIFKEFNTLRKSVEAANERHLAELAMLNEEMRDELVSREAVAARTADRFRTFGESSATHATFDKAHNTASAIELSIAALCSNSLSVNQGTEQLHRQIVENGAQL